MRFSLTFCDGPKPNFVVRHAVRCLICLVLCGWLSGCAVDQQKEIEQHRKIVELPAPPPVDSSQPLTLRKALLLANHQNESLSIEGERYLQALINRQLAIANFLPTFDLTPTYFRRDAVGGATGGTAQNSGLDVSVVGRANLFNGFRDVAQLRVADLSILQRQALLLDTQEALLADVVRVFYQVLRDEELIRVLENSLKVQEERVRDMQARQAAGVARPLDVAQTEAQASGTRVTLIDARNSVRNARSALSFLTGSAVHDMKFQDDYALPASESSWESLLQIAKARRQDYLAAIEGTRAARHAVDVAFRAYYPSVSINLEGFLYRETIPDDRAWEGLLSANLPLFSAGRIHAEVRRAWSQFRQAQLFESLTRRQIDQDIRQAYENYVSSGFRLAELKTQVTAAQQAFRQADESYNAGLATNLERVVAQDRLLNAELDLAGEQFNRKIAYLDILRAIGSLREEFESPGN